MPKINNQSGLVPLVALMIGAVVLIGGFFVLRGNYFSGSSWLSQVDLTKCDQIAKRSKLSNVIVVGSENKGTYKCIAGARDIGGTIGYLDRDGDIKIRLNYLGIDAIFDDQGVIDSKVSNIRQYGNPAPGNVPTHLAASKYWDKKYDDVFQEVEFLADVPGILDGLSRGTVVITKKGTFDTSEGKGAYVMFSVSGVYDSYAKAKKGHCVISMEITSELDSKAYDPDNHSNINTGVDSGKTKTEKLTIELMQDLVNAVGNECGGGSNVTKASSVGTNNDKSPKQVNSGSTNGFDCLATLPEVVEPSNIWKTLGKVTAEKGTLAREDNDYCLLKHKSRISDLATNMAQVENPDVLWTVKITYLKNGISPDKAFEQIDKLKRSEKANFQIKSDQINTYSGYTVDLTGPHYLRDVIFQGHCLIEQTVENDLTPTKAYGLYWSLDDVKSYMNMTAGWVGGLQYNLLGNQNFANFCK